jgi:hypothetical protein
MNVSHVDLVSKAFELIPGFDKVKLARLAIAGIEVTQAIQYYRAAEHLTDPADRGPDNSVRLIAGKPAWVRVYPWSLWGVSGVTGELEVQRRSQGFLWQTVATLGPMPPALSEIPSVLQTDYATMRSTLDQSLNFVVPGDQMIGTLRLTARVRAGALEAEHTIVVPVTLRQTLRLAGVMIAYDGPSSMAPNAPDIQLAAPNLADLQVMAATALTLYPVRSQAEFRSAGSLTLTTHLQDTSFPASGCGAGWNALHAQVVNARTADGNQAGWIYYGLLPTGVPMGPVGGCGGGGVGVGPTNAPGTLAHEAGHAAGLGHAPAGGAPNPDPAFPTYEPYPAASIGEYGLDVNNGNIASPQLFRDFMAYGGPAWISLYHYGRLLDNAILNPTTVGVDSPWWKDKVFVEWKKWPWVPEPDPPPFDLELPLFPPDYPLRDVISLIVRIDRGTVADVAHVARTRVRTHIELARVTRFVACLRGEDGAVLAEAPLLRLPTLAGPCGGCQPDDGGEPTSFLAQAFVPDVAPGARLEIGDGKEVLWSREAPKRPASIETFDVRVERKGKSGSVLQVAWGVAGEVAEIWVRWSKDGEVWRSLATGLTGENAEFDLRALPHGALSVQLVAHDGFYSTYSETVRIELPKRPPEVSILHPVDGHSYVAGQSLRLWGTATGGDEASLPARSGTWSLGRRRIAEGLDAWTTLEPGEHVLTLEVEGDGGTGRARVRVIVSTPPGSAG